MTNLNKSDKLTMDSLAQLMAVIMTARKATAPHLDNSKLESTAISLPRKDENDMARKRIRREVEIDGQKVWISGDTEQEYVENYAAKLESIRNRNGTTPLPVNRPLCPTFQSTPNNT